MKGECPTASLHQKEFHDEEHEVFTYEDLKRGYFRLLADNMISEIVPHAVYDSESDLYELHLKVKMEDNFSVRLGAVSLPRAQIKSIWE